ncbi:MAG: LysM peptidoglycan-binding domain-containing protein [bacterium]|nr:LysM peptidoglycan-binding domain-containing protein [bacterium]
MKPRTIMLALMVFATIGYAQEKLTYVQATSLIAQYKGKETELQTSITNGTAEVDSLKNVIAQLDVEISTLTTRVEELRAATAEPECTYYVVQEGDFLAKLAEYKEVYGRGNYAKWPKIYNANRDLIKNPTVIQPGWKLKVPRP